MWGYGRLSEYTGGSSSGAAWICRLWFRFSRTPGGAAWGRALRGGVGYAKESSDSILIAVLVCTPILFTPYLDDDTINSTLPSLISSGETTLWQHIHKYTLQWMQNEGRFFPGSLTWTYGVFATFTDRLAYKSLLFVLSITCLLTVWGFFRWALGRRPSVPTVLVLSGLWALRPSAFDPLTSFAGLLPMTVIASLAGTMLLGIRGAFSWFSVGCCGQCHSRRTRCRSCSCQRWCGSS